METVIRVTIIYLFILFGLRVLGKREFSQLSPIELVTLLLIPELVAQALVREDFSLTNAIVGVTTLFGLVFITSLVAHLNPRMERVISGAPTVLVTHGQLIETNMHKERISPEELFSEMHKAGLYKLEQVKWAVLESDGKIAFIAEENAGQQQEEDDVQV